MSELSSWGVQDGKIVRKVADEVEEVPAEAILAKLLAKARTPPEKSLTDRATELLFHWIACQVRPATSQSDDEHLAREAVRWCRALESEVAHETKRPETKPRAARRPVDDEEEWP